MVGDDVTIFLEILNLEGHQNCITGSRFTAILLNGWIFPIGQSGEASHGGSVINGAYPVYLLAILIFFFNLAKLVKYQESISVKIN